MMQRSLLRLRNTLNRRFESTIPILKLVPRPADQLGTRAGNRLRNIFNHIPGVVYGRDKDGNVVKELVAVDKKEINKFVRDLGESFENTLIRIQVGENTTQMPLVTFRGSQFNTVTGELFCVNYLVYHPKAIIHIPVDFINEELNDEIKKGAVLLPVTRFVECTCENEVPAKLLVDISKTPKNGVLRLEHVQFPNGVKPYLQSKTLEQQKSIVLGVIRDQKGG